MPPSPNKVQGLWELAIAFLFTTVSPVASRDFQIKDG